MNFIGQKGTPVAKRTRLYTLVSTLCISQATLQPLQSRTSKRQASSKLQSPTALQRESGDAVGWLGRSVEMRGVAVNF